MDSSALPSEAHIKGLEYHALRTLARVHGLKATGPREQIRERLLKWRAEIVPEHNPVGHSADNEGAAPCSASGSGTATKENSGAAPKRSTARKRKAEEIDSENAPAAHQSKKILVDSNVINTDVPPSPSPSQPAQPHSTLLSSLPETPLPSSTIPSPPLPLQCPGIPQHPLQTWDTMFFIQDPDLRAYLLQIQEYAGTSWRDWPTRKELSGLSTANNALSGAALASAAKMEEDSDIANDTGTSDTCRHEGSDNEGGDQGANARDTLPSTRSSDSKAEGDDATSCVCAGKRKVIDVESGESDQEPTSTPRKQKRQWLSETQVFADFQVPNQETSLPSTSTASTYYHNRLATSRPPSPPEAVSSAVNLRDP
ncbi:hypothetical protein DFH11DRAFT_1543293 [Phellopilus nigrolimitatus]|nr:hypothetical protein DFH11DRAFT_1543293 [Phellopilus nigrolimitatus]